MPIAEEDIGTASMPSGDGQEKEVRMEVAIAVVVSEQRVIIGHGNHVGGNGDSVFQQGSRYAAAALIDRAVEEAAATGGRWPLVVLTGGGAEAVRPLIRSAAVGVPDLVLRGLAVLAQRRGSAHRR